MKGLQEWKYLYKVYHILKKKASRAVSSLDFCIKSESKKACIHGNIRINRL